MTTISLDISTLEELESLYTSATVCINQLIHLPTEQERATLSMWKGIQSKSGTEINRARHVTQ